MDDQHGVITEGNFSRQYVHLDGDTRIEGGNWLFARIVTHGFSLEVTGGNTRGLRIDGVKQDDFVLREYGPLLQAQAILDELASGGADAYDAWEAMVEVVHMQIARITWDEFRAAYLDAYHGLVYSGKLLESVELGGNLVGWDNVQDFIANHSFDQLMGRPTELVREES